MFNNIGTYTPVLVSRSTCVTGTDLWFSWNLKEFRVVLLGDRTTDD